MTTEIVKVSRAKEKRFIEEANHPLKRARKIGMVIGLMFCALPITIEIIDYFT
jgi:hypothetical protein